MTTSVEVTAHCPNTIEVHVTVSEKGVPDQTTVLQNGETTSKYAYDSRTITVKEVVKEA